MHNCHKCSTEITLEGSIGLKEECPNCAASLHSCCNCRFHDPAAHNQCREPGTEFIRDREAANFCDSFGMRDRDAGDAGSGETEAAKSALADLFKI